MHPYRASPGKHSCWLHFVPFAPQPHALQYAPHTFSPPTNAHSGAALASHSVGRNVGELHEDAHMVFKLLPGATPRRQPAMGPEGASHGPPSLPREVPSFVCHELANGPGAKGS